MANDDWDIESYRNDYESDEHWQLKKDFMEAHKKNFTEDELVCLAQLFFNIELLGCRYSPEVMRQIGELSKGIVEDYRKSRQSNLKRTFISGGNAAMNKVQRK
ncbi:partner of xrn-2 protein 1-like [Chironomus tepperi]|uniref:partner of xrn-2 protein 1-like n=1 Tax=Chironomus tepperi TaxID=113505 RepID=UPI00391EE5CF